MSKDPEKAARWRALPLRYKLFCWFGVIPLFAASIAVQVILPSSTGGFVSLGLGVVAVTAYACLEIACVSWYRANGHL